MYASELIYRQPTVPCRFGRPIVSSSVIHSENGKAHKTLVDLIERELFDTVKARKLAYYDHTMRKQGSCLEKEIMQGTMPSARRRGRPRTAMAIILSSNLILFSKCFH